MNNQEELEKELLSCILQKPELYQTRAINKYWFRSQHLLKIFLAINHLGGEFDNVMDVWAELNLSNALDISLSDLQELKQFSPTTANFHQIANLLEQNYLQTTIQEVSKAYAEQPTKENLETLRAFLAIADEETSLKNDGQLFDEMENLEDALNNPMPSRAIKTYAKLDHFFSGGLEPGMLITIGARPSVGKTAFATVNLAIKALQRNQDISVMIFSLEMTKKDILLRYVACLTGIPSNKLKRPSNDLTESEKGQVKQAIEIIKKWDIKVFDNRATITQIQAIVRKELSSNKKDKNLVIIDYLGLIDGSKDSNKDRRLQLEEITRNLKVMANQLGLSVVLLSQLNRSIEGRNDKTPLLSDLRETGAIEQDSNAVGFLYRDEEENNLTYLTFRKNREGELGTIKFEFDGAKMLFKEILY